MSQETYVSIGGEYEREMRAILEGTERIEPGDTRVSVSPLDMDLRYNIMSHDGTLPTSTLVGPMNKLTC